MNIYDFNVKKADGTETSLKEYEGKTLLIVNTASNCGYTKQLFGLERDYLALKDQGYEVLAFPCNQFLKQEPDPIDDVVKNYHDKYGVTFPIFDKIDVNGENEHPLFNFLKQALPFDPETKTPAVMIPIYIGMNIHYKESPDVKWNFTKFLIDKAGNPVKRFEPEATPSTLVDEIKKYL